MIEEILCEAKSRVRSIASLCEEFGVRRLVQKEPTKNPQLKIVNDEIIFVRGKVAKAQHSWPM